MHKSTRSGYWQTFPFLLIAITAALAATSCGGTARSTNLTSSPTGSGPSVSITAPGASATVSGTVTVTATASSSVGIASVQFQVDGSNVGSALTTSPYSYSWNTTALSNGTHTLTAVAKDTSNQSTTSTGVSVKVSNTVAAPTVSITAPAASATVSGTVTVTATASSSVGIASVQFQVDGSNVGSALTAAPYNFLLDTTTLTNASHTLVAVAKDTTGTTASSAGVTVTVSNAVSTSMGPLVHSTTNSRYFVIQGTSQAVLLAGSHTWNDFLDIGTNGTATAFDFNGFVNFLKTHGQNATILWRKDLPTECGWQGANWVETPWPWNRPGPGTASDGGLKYDLTSYNSAYLTRLQQRVGALQQAGIYAIVELFDGNNAASARCGTNTSANGDGFPFTGANNINSVNDSYTSGNIGAGAFTMGAINAITNAEDAFVVQEITALNQYQNVIYEIAEEQPGAAFSGTSGYGGTSSITFWAPHVYNLVKTVEAGGTFNGTTYPGLPLRHPVGIGAMNATDVNATGQFANDTLLYSSPMDWVAPTINGNFANQFPSNVPTNNQGKVIINDSDHSYDAQTILNSDGTVNNSQARQYIWENVTNGAGGVLLMDPYVISLPNTSPVRNVCGSPVNGVCTGSLDSKYEPFRTALGVVPPLASRLDLVKNTPQPNLSSTGFCLADAVGSGAEYLVYAPNGGTFTVNLSATTHSLNVEWINPVNGAVTLSGTVIGGSSSQSFTSPSGTSQDALLYLVDVAGHN